MRARAIVPQKPLVLAKGRLAAALGARSRAALSLALLQHICATLRASPDVEDVVVMTPDHDVRARAAAWGVRAILDPAPGLNPALAGALVPMTGWSHGILIVAGDLPFLEVADVVALLGASTRRALAIAPSRDGTGTNALALPPGVLISPAFGRGSFATHRRQALALGLAVAEIARSGWAFDLDTPADLAAYLTARERA